MYMYMYMFSYNHYRKHVIILCFYKNLDFIISTTRYLKIGLYDVKKKPCFAICLGAVCAKKLLHSNSDVILVKYYMRQAFLMSTSNLKTYPALWL